MLVRFNTPICTFAELSICIAGRNTKSLFPASFSEYSAAAVLQFIHRIPVNALQRREIIDAVLAIANEGGAFGTGAEFDDEWNWLGNTDQSDTDETATVLIALRHFADDTYVDAVIATSEAFLLAQRNEDGTFGNAWNEVSSSSTALAMMALGDIDLDILLDNFRTADGGFGTDTEADSDEFSTVDILAAILAVYATL